MYKLTLTDETRRVYEKANTPLARKLAKCFRLIEANPRAGNNAKPLKGPLAGRWRYRAGDYRMVYFVDDPARIVSVIAIAHRRNVYE